MKIIPKQYQELEVIFDAINRENARCIAFASPYGHAGATSLAVSVARRLSGRNERVLVIDLNTFHPMSDKDLISMPNSLAKWSFVDISCQLNAQVIDNFYFLSITQLQDLTLVREKDVFNTAILMLKQEFDYILFDMSPICKKHHANFPLHLIISVTDLLLLDISLGKTTQDTLDAVINELEQVNCKRYEIVVSQIFMPPLGDCLIKSINRRCYKLPKLRQFLTNLVNKQHWLFTGV
ncbi:AAA family ATPase [Pseudoalteromonas sp.]|uniref:AAA family ATPase n=1 Tax=Pseudoalteromonas sp. TaxID=53249 RepID=UPI003561730D